MKKAFLVGINAYPTQPLRGCVNDALTFATYLKDEGFAVDLCLNDCATYTSIISGIKKLTNGAMSGDTLVFYFSGHGSQIPDTSGDESDGLDEILCPINTNFHNGIYITDDELYSLFKNMPSSINVEIILDCCHSGTGIRDLTGIRSKFMPPPKNLTRKEALKTRYLSLRNKEQKGSFIVWSACSANETAADVEITAANYRGAFTYTFLNLICNQNYKRNTLIEQVSFNMKQRGWLQTAQLECDASQSNQFFCNKSAITKVTNTLTSRLKSLLKL